jgi:hypothetical protein
MNEPEIRVGDLVVSLEGAFAIVVEGGLFYGDGLEEPFPQERWDELSPVVAMSGRHINFVELVEERAPCQMKARERIGSQAIRAK